MKLTSEIPFLSILITVALHLSYSYKFGFNRVLHKKFNYNNRMELSMHGFDRLFRLHATGLIQSYSNPISKSYKKGAKHSNITQSNASNGTMVMGRSGMGSAINDYIIKYFKNITSTHGNASNKSLMNFVELKSFLQQYENQLTYVHIITLLFNSARHKISVSSIIPVSFISKVLNSSVNGKIEKHKMSTTFDANKTETNEFIFEPREVSNALYGLKSVFNPSSSTHPSRDQNEIILAITKMISMCSNSDFAAYNKTKQHQVSLNAGFTSQQIANSYYGFQNLKSEWSIVRHLLKALNDKIEQSRQSGDSDKHAKLNDIEIGSALYGLRQMSLQHIEVVDTLNIILSFMKHSLPKGMNQKSIGLAFNGLQNFHFMNENATIINIHAVTPYDNDSTESHSQNFKKTSYIPKSRMTRTNQILEELLTLLTENIKHSDFSDMSSTTLASVFQGLREFSNDNRKYNLLLMSLSEKLDTVTTMIPFTEESVGQIIGCFKNLKDSHPATRKIVKSLIRHIDASDFSLSPRKFTFCLSGLKSMNGWVFEIKELLNILLLKLDISDIETYNITDQNNHYTDHKKHKLSSSHLNSQDLSRALYGLQNMNAKYNKPLQSVLQYLYTTFTSPLYADLYLTNKDIGCALYGFKSQHYKDKTPIIAEWLVRLGQMVGNIPGTQAAIMTVADQYYLSSQTLSMAMLGLQGMKHNTEGVEGLLEGLTQRMSHIDSQGIGNILYSMGHMSTDSEIVRNFLKKLNSLILKHSNSGLYSSSSSAAASNNEGVTSMIKTSVSQTGGVTTGDDTSGTSSVLSTQEFANALWGMRGMDSKHAEVRELVSTLADLLYTQVLYSNKMLKAQMKTQQRLNYVLANQKYQSSTGNNSTSSPLNPAESAGDSTHSSTALTYFSFHGKEISMAISGLQSMSAQDGPEILFLLGLLADRLDVCKDELKPMEIANILYGLQGMTGEHEEVRAILTALLPKFRECTGVFTAKDIGFCLAGMTGMQPTKLVYDEIMSIFEEINIKVAGSELKGRPELLFEVFANGGIKIK